MRSKASVSSYQPPSSWPSGDRTLASIDLMRSSISGSERVIDNSVASTCSHSSCRERQTSFFPSSWERVCAARPNSSPARLTSPRDSNSAAPRSDWPSPPSKIWTSTNMALIVR